MPQHEYLELEHLATFRHARFEWSPGINVLTGINGTGKTQILRVLYLASKLLAIRNVNPSHDRMVSFAPLARTDSSQYRICGKSFGAEWSLDGVNDRMEGRFGAVSPFEQILIPSESVLSHTKGFLALWNFRQLDFEQHYADLVQQLLVPEVRELDDLASELLSVIEGAIGGRFELEGERFVFHSSAGVFDAPVVAEGFQKMGILQRLIATGFLARGSVLFWDEPENQLHPRLLGVLADVLKKAASGGVQVICTTHSYLLLKEFEYRRSESNPTRFFALDLDYSQGRVPHSEVSWSDSLAELEPNAIRDQYLAVLDRELDGI